MKTIQLNKGKVALVDDGDFSWLSKYTWYFSDTGYAKTSLWEDGKALQIRMHRLIMGAKRRQMCDHINGDKLDNRRENLRLCNNAENMRNRGMTAKNTSGFKGVYWDKGRRKWHAQIKIFYKQKYLGLFEDKKDAARAYNEAAKNAFGEFAHLNII